MKKTIISVVGQDTVGIIARVCTYLAENNINILDISQTIIEWYCKFYLGRRHDDDHRHQQIREEAGPDFRGVIQTG